MGDERGYQGVREEPSSFASYGTGRGRRDKLVLTGSNGEKSYYRARQCAGDARQKAIGGFAA